MKNNDIPEHVSQNISTGEAVLSTSMANIKFGSKAYSKVLCVITTEKLMADTKKILIKLFLSKIITVENKKGKIRLYTTSRSGKEEIVLFDPIKNPGEKKAEFLERVKKIGEILEGAFDGSYGSEQVVVKSDSKPDSASGPPPKLFCSNCGSKLPTGGTFCAECGTRVK